MTNPKKPSKQEAVKERHPSRGPLPSKYPMLSGEKLRQLQNDLNEDYQISPQLKKRSGGNNG